MFKWLFKKKGCAKHMNNKLEVIGIDHGWSMMKTISQVFVTGVKEITTTPALFGDVLEYEGKFYKVGTVRQGSSSRNYDVLGRELFTPDEVRKLDNKKCIIFIRGFVPIMDNKFIPFNHPMFNQTADGKGEPYVHQIMGADNLIGPPFEILSDKAVKYYEKLKDKGENVYIDSLTYEQFMMLGDAELSRRFSMQDEAEQKAKIDREQENELEYVDESQKSDAAESDNASNGSAGAKPVRNPEREKPKWEDTITNRMLHWSYTPEQKEEVKKALAAGVPIATILTYFYPEVTVEKMSSYRKKH